MKLVVIQSAEAHHHNLSEIFHEIEINTYNEIKVDGFMNNHDVETNLLNWFAADKRPYRYIVSMAFLPKEKVKLLLERIREFNNSKERISPINAYAMNVNDWVVL